MEKKKIEVLQLGHKTAFGNYSLNVMYTDMSVDILPISQKVFNILSEKYELAMEV